MSAATEPTPATLEAIDRLIDGIADEVGAGLAASVVGSALAESRGSRLVGIAVVVLWEDRRIGATYRADDRWPELVAGVAGLHHRLLTEGT